MNDIRDYSQICPFKVVAASQDINFPLFDTRRDLPAWSGGAAGFRSFLGAVLWRRPHYAL